MPGQSDTDGRPHKGLEAWQQAMELCVAVYAATKDLPASERFGLTQQMRNAATSVPTNIAEGAAKGTSREFVRSLYIARGELAELDTQLEIAQRLGYLADAKAIKEHVDRVARLVSGLIRRLKERA
jgi:four helix bundle protein